MAEKDISTIPQQIVKEQVPKKKNDRVLTRFALGGASCVCAAMVTNPIDTVKTRLQMAGEKSRGPNAVQYRGFLRSAMIIVQNETVRGLYKGVAASCLRESTYSAIRLGGYDVLKGAVVGDKQGSGVQFFLGKLFSGMISGFVGAALTTPTDVIKVRMQADEAPWGQKRRYATMRVGFLETYRQGGFKGLYDGWQPNAYRAAILTGTQIATYDHCKHLVKKSGLAKEGVPLHIGASIAAGLVASIATSPFDLVKTRIMRSPGLYSSAIQCTIITVKNEGPFALWKGFFAQWIRIGPHTLTAFVVLEQLRRLLGMEAVGV